MKKWLIHSWPARQLARFGCELHCIQAQRVLEECGMESAALEPCHPFPEADRREVKTQLDDHDRVA